MLSQIFCCRLIERQHRGACGKILRDPRIALIDRIDAVFNELAIFAGGLPRLLQRHIIDRAEPHVAGFAAVQRIAENP